MAASDAKCYGSEEIKGRPRAGPESTEANVAGWQ